MKLLINKIIVLAAIAVIIAGCGTANSKPAFSEKQNVIYACIPCGYNCDTVNHTKPGICGICNMALVEKSTIIHKNIEPDKLCSLDGNNVLFLDVRTPEEFNGTAKEKFGAIRNAINIPVQELEKRMTELEKYKDKEILVYCSHSHRSPRASYMLTKKGFKNVMNMLGGMSVWKDEVKDNSCNEKLYIKQ